MTLKERLAYLVVIATLAGALIVTAAVGRRTESSTTFRHIEIVDPAGNPRVIIGTDSSGTSEIRFVSADGKKASYLQQYSDGSTSLRFAGPGNEPSVLIDAMQAGPGPIVFLRGNHEDQKLFMGAADHQDDVPSASPKAFGWGFYVPAGGFKPPYAAIGAWRDMQTGKIQGFVHPEK